MIYHEINTNLKLRDTKYVIPLQSIFIDESEVRQAHQKVKKYVVHMIFDFGITLLEFIETQ